MLTQGGRGKGGEMTQTLYAYINKRKKCLHKLGVVAHTCNPRYSGGRDQEAQSPDWPGHKQETLFKKHLTQGGLAVWLKWESTYLQNIRL
jgi:hypothetical protein